jgi:hypothetical protein
MASTDDIWVEVWREYMRLVYFEWHTSDCGCKTCDWNNVNDSLERLPVIGLLEHLRYKTDYNREQLLNTHTL